MHQLLEKIQETARWSLHRALRGEGRQPVLLKIAVDGEHRDPRAVEQLEHEYEVTARLGSAATLRALAFERIGGAPALVLEDFGGVPLRHFMAERLEPDRVLALAIAVTAAVGELHRHGVLHKDLKPDSVLVDPVTGEVKLTGLGIASPLPRELQPAVSPAGIGLGVIEGTLAYMSPEQTGRMNRALDQRSDLYALGVTFYEMATGSLPFSAADPLDWIHWHMAGVPRPPHEVEARVPPSLSAVILKLLAKTPDERYQSAVGLGRDLERCRDRWRAGRTEPFPLGSDDVSERLQMPQRLYGRQRPSGELLRAFERVATEGTPELVLVAGSAGVGKSALVRELERPVTARGGFFLYDKVDQLRGAIPCAPFVRALRELIRDLLAGTDLALAGWRARLQAAVGDNGRIIIDVIPELEAIIGPQPPVAELRPIEARTRFDRTFLRFIGAFTSPEHPLVIVLDDLQWADSGSLNLIRNIAGSGGLRHLLLVGTYRPGGDQGVAELRPAKASVRELELVALSVADLRALVSDAFGAGEPESEALAALLHQKTGGNPFFVIQFVDTLWREGLVQFDPTSRGWRWDLARIAGKGVTSNLVDLMTERLLRLPERVRRTLSMAAALGDGLAALPLARIDGRPAPDVEEDLLRAAHEGLLLREGQRYRFTHDRVQEAAYALIPPGGRQAAHLRIGRALLAATPPERIDEALFDIVSQLDRGAALIVDPAERRRLAELALRAGRRAKAANAYAPALRFFVAGLEALPEDASPGQGASYELGQALLLGRGECELLSGHPDEARRLSVRLAERARTKLDAVAAHLLAQDAMLVTGDILAAVADQRQTLALLGIDLPARPTRADAEAARDQVRALLGDRPLESILDLPAMDDPELEAAMRVTSTAALTDSNLYCVHVCLLTALSLQRGLCASSSLWFGSYGFVLVRFFEDPALGHRFAQVAHQLAERTADRGARGRTRFFLVVSSYWMGPPDELQAHARAGLEDALEAGDLIVAGYHHALGVTALLQDGELLERVAAEAQASIDFSRRFGLRDIVDDLVVVRQLARCLRGGTVALSSLDDPDFSEMAFEAGLTAERLTHLRCWYWIARMRVAFTAGDPERALAFFTKAEELAWVISGQSIERDLRFYGALAMAAQAGRSGPEEGAAWLAKIDRLRAPIGRWARLNPARFAHQEALIAAEMARLRGAAEEAGPLYEESLRRAREGGFVHDQALAYELAAQFHRERGFTAFADLYLREAHAAYLRWGAEGKARDLERLHPAVLTPPDSSAAAAATTWRARSEQIDLLSVVKASQAISQETVHDRLLERLMQVVLAQSGASQGWLVLRRRGDLSIAAEAALAADGVRVVIPAEKTLAPERLPISVLQYTARTGLPVVIDDTTEGGRFSGDEYLRRERPRSVLCLAIERQGEVVGMLYLENRTLVGAFTGGRLTVLELLAAQVAISLENARALGETEAARAAAEQAVAVRDEFLSIASHELNTPMNALMLSLEGMLGRGGLTPDPVTFSRLATLAERQGRRLTHVVRDLLDVTRAERGELRLRPTSVDLAALVRDDVASLHPELARTGSEVSLDLEEGVVGWWDPARIDQVVVNLLSNAAKFGGGRPIAVRLERAAERARLTVSDQGIGIDAEGQARIFHRFERRVSAAHYGGLGLGLYICRRIVEAHGGTIAVHSVPGAGASFTVELPCRRTEEAGR